MKKFYLKNPLRKDVSTQYNLDGTIVYLTAKGEDITDFENETLFGHMRDYLVEEILNERGVWHFDEERKKVRDEVTYEPTH